MLNYIRKNLCVSKLCILITRYRVIIFINNFAQIYREETEIEHSCSCSLNFSDVSFTVGLCTV